jgi:DNA invertase Pin-like site-specific DNA recombinase
MLPSGRLPTLHDVIIDHIKRTIISCNGNKSEAARKLGIARSTLFKILKNNDGYSWYDKAISQPAVESQAVEDSDKHLCKP